MHEVGVELTYLELSGDYKGRKVSIKKYLKTMFIDFYQKMFLDRSCFNK